MRIVESLDRKRQAAGWSISRLAREAGVGRSHLSRILSGATQPTAPTIEKLAAALEQSADKSR